MYSFKKNCLLLIFYLVCCTSCQKCCRGSQQAPTLELLICNQIGSLANDWEIFAKDGSGKQPKLVANRATLPISLLADTILFIF
jgi:hypothetical protein